MSDFEEIEDDPNIILNMNSRIINQLPFNINNAKMKYILEKFINL